LNNFFKVIAKTFCGHGVVVVVVVVITAAAAVTCEATSYSVL